MYLLLISNTSKQINICIRTKSLKSFLLMVKFLFHTKKKLRIESIVTKEFCQSNLYVHSLLSKLALLQFLMHRKGRTNVSSLFNSLQNRQFYIVKKIKRGFVYSMHCQVEGNLNTLIGLINSTTKLENESQRNRISLTFLSYYLFLISKINIYRSTGFCL